MRGEWGGWVCVRWVDDIVHVSEGRYVRVGM